MASAAQFEANRLKFGPFSAQNCVRPEETQEYTKLSKALWKGLNPVGAVEQMLAVEIVRAAWRLHRCAVAEAKDGETPATQASVDRARASAHNSMRRFLSELRQFQSDRWLRAEVLREGFDEDYIGIADTHRVIKGLAENERLKSQFFTAPIGIDPLNQTIRTQSTSANPSRDREGGVSAAQVPLPVSPVAPVVFAAGEAKASKPISPLPTPKIRTQSVGPTLSPGNPSRAGASVPPPPFGAASAASAPTPRNAPCPCHSGVKYKRCCGVGAPPVLTNSAIA
jgi:hypothetical protein